MYADGKTGSPLSVNIMEKPESGRRISSVHPTDEGVAIPKEQTLKKDVIMALPNENKSDSQKDTKETLLRKSSKKKEVRTFSDSRWYVALVRTKCEKKTHDIINGFDERHRVKVWLPMQSVQRKIDGETKITYRLNIHNYLFFHLSQTDERNDRTRYEIFRDIRSITHVQDLLIDPATQTAAVIPNSQIESFKRMLSDSRHPVRLIVSMVCKGTRVRFVSGELRGFEGTVENLSEKNAEVFIRLGCLGCAGMTVRTELLEIIDDTPKDNSSQIGKGKIVTMGEWLALHPYNEQTSIDKLYVDFGNAVLRILSTGTFCVPNSNQKTLAMLLSSYMEDKQSRLGIFAHFVRMRYGGMRHPLQAFLPDDYDKEKFETIMTGYDEMRINVIDLMYFLQVCGNGKRCSLEGLLQQASGFSASIEKTGCSHLPSNKQFAKSLFYTLHSDGQKGLKRFLSWVAHRVSYYSCGTIPVPDASHIFIGNPQAPSDEPLAFALNFARRMKAKSAVTRSIKSMLDAQPEEYTVVGCYRKAVHFMSKDGTRRIVYLDEISSRDYTVGERYRCRLAELEKDKWYMVEPPIIIK